MWRQKDRIAALVALVEDGERLLAAGPDARDEAFVRGQLEQVASSRAGRLRARSGR